MRDTGGRPSEYRESRQDLAAFALAAIVRAGAWLHFDAPDPNYYYWLSEAILTEGAFTFGSGPTSFIEPAYPAFLAAVRTIGGTETVALLLQCLVAASGAVAIRRLTKAAGGSTLAAWAAAGFYSVDPYFVRQSVSYIELPLLVPLALWSFERFMVIRSTGGAGASGALFGLLLLTRSSLAPAPVAALAILSSRRQWRHATAFALALAFVLLPWTIRSLRAGHGLLPTRVGENLFLSTSAFAIGVTPRYDIDLLVDFARPPVEEALGEDGRHDERAADRVLTQRALEFVAARPAPAITLKLRNLLWIPCPVLLPRNAKDAATRAELVDGHVRIVDPRSRPVWWEIAHATFRTLVLVCAVAGLARHRRLDSSLLICVLALETVTYTVFFPTTRLLAVWSAVLMVYAGIGLSRAAGRP